MKDIKNIEVDSEGLRIRAGRPEDLDEIMQIATLACDENGFLNPNPAKLAAEIYPALCFNYGIVGLIGKPNDKIEGVVLLRIGTMWYADDYVVEEKAIFSKRVADTLGIPLIIGVLSNSRTEAKVRMYERQFGKPSGAFFLYGAKTGKENRREH
jgi:hypothetical protein